MYALSVGFDVQPPTADLAEQVVLAALFPPLSVDPNSLGIEPQHCADPVHAAILEAALLHAVRGQPVTIDGLAVDLHAALDEVRGSGYLTRLADPAPTPEAVTSAAVAVRDAWLCRQLVDIGGRLLEFGEGVVLDAHETSDHCSARYLATLIADKTAALSLEIRALLEPQATAPLRGNS